MDEGGEGRSMLVRHEVRGEILDELNLCQLGHKLMTRYSEKSLHLASRWL